MIVNLISKTFHIHPGCAVCFCREGGEDGDSQGDGSSQPDTISIASRTSQNTVDSDKVGNTVAEHQILTSWRPTAVSALQGFLCSLNEQQQGLGMLTVWSGESVQFTHVDEKSSTMLPEKQSVVKALFRLCAGTCTDSYQAASDIKVRPFVLLL